MPRPQFGHLSKIWTESIESSTLIRQYIPMVTRKALEMDRSYPGEDFESAYMEGLYVAAFSFHLARENVPWEWWLHMQLRKRNKDVIYRANRSKNLGKRVSMESIDLLSRTTGRIRCL